ncbi:uncharacterized protein B0I36DRAFT_362424 [Microdochium trichocladiopsis]|uniref:histidine kinase n=1 Tax=Microdochium trichocladiopsis TaxID=1682393 RepID=A0A9P9BQ88_9PEZI|nr:uncharacterized protein B0I36DRAFT_362424 [Microdochium trichocladiopsis]KAH7030588.1 hypothetical protein B0I36DRAFT_362424 [Microdochium trichocladiopsis]
MAAAPPKDRDAARSREVRQCLESWQTAQGSSINVALNVDNIGFANLQRTGYTPQASPDRTLTAFAQLAVLRLGVERAMVSLIDSSTQTILAEATQEDSHSPADDLPHAPATLWLGTTVLARHDAVCEHCLDGSYTPPPSTGPDGMPQKSHTTQAFVVPDCSLDPRFQNRPYVRDSPFIRFYAGVPIISRSGHKIGAYAVSDGRARAGLDLRDVQFMQGMARTIMEHLEWARDRVDRFKGERIVRGLAAFVESSSGPAADAAPSRPASTASSDRLPRSPPVAINSPRHPLTRQTSYFGPRDVGVASTQPAQQGLGIHEALEVRTPGSLRSASGPRKPSRGRGQDKEGVTAKLDAMSTMLQQAADILCQSTLADGAVILGASASTSRQTSWAAATAMHGLSSSDEDEPALPSSPGVPDGVKDVLENMASPSSFRGDKLSRVLAYSIIDQQTRAMFEQGQGALTLGTLERYYTMYPKGKTFSFTGHGATITSEDDSASERETPLEPGSKLQIPLSHDHNNHHERLPHSRHHHHRARRKPQADHTELLQRIPGAKTVIFVPLIDHTENSFSGGYFLWTSVAGRLITLDTDLSYLRAFANSIMSQVARISAQKNEAAKTTFIASMSHELRSPLHGILGAAEFLTDTSADSFQAGLISSISTCGKTLLDTLNHVLDYSKINRLGRSRRRRSTNKEDEPSRGGAISSDSLDSLNLTAVIDLSALVEEVVDAIVTGHTFKALPGTVVSQAKQSPIISGLTSSSLNSNNTNKKPQPVSVMLDITPPGTWLVRTQPGALRRIVMNLFGNALKYTSAGFVMVALSVKQTTEAAQTDVLIRVIDSGKGMSAEFQRDRLFVPFMQEDHFQPGTGLGLSIVKQIVDSLGGSIDVTSEQGKGTEIDVRASLPTAVEHGMLDQELAWIRRHARGLRMVILDTDIEAHGGKVAARQADRLHQAIAKTCKTWFGLDVVHEQDRGAGLDADLFIYCEPPSMEALEQRFRDDKTLSRRKWQIPVIIVCLDAQEVLRISRSQKETLAKGYGRIVELIPQPCGPRKLAKVIELCLRKAEELAYKATPGDEDHLSSPMQFESKKKGPTAEEQKRRDGLSLEDRDQDVLQTDPTSIPMRPMEDDEKDGQVDDGANGNSHDNNDEGRDLEAPEAEALKEMEVQQHEGNKDGGVDAVHVEAPQPAAIMQDAQKPPQTSNNEAEPLRVLVVDDNKINLQLLVMFMKKCGFSYEEAENGKEALDHYTAAAHARNSAQGPPSDRDTDRPRRAAFDWILMDISMPVMDGIEATQRIRDFELEQGLAPATVVALTGLASDDAQRDAKLAGVDIFMAKPVRFAALKKEMLATSKALPRTGDNSSAG